MSSGDAYVGANCYGHPRAIMAGSYVEASIVRYLDITLVAECAAIIILIV